MATLQIEFCAIQSDKFLMASVLYQFYILKQINMHKANTETANYLTYIGYIGIGLAMCTIIGFNPNAGWVQQHGTIPAAAIETNTHTMHPGKAISIIEHFQQ